MKARHSPPSPILPGTAGTKTKTRSFPPLRFFAGSASSQLTAIASSGGKARNILITRNVEKASANARVGDGVEYPYLTTTLE